jgi:LacI family transcriptional regulator
MKNISIKDIARQLGVSTTTVSFVLNGKAKEKRISDDLKNKIVKLAAKLNYRPNQIARGLRTGQTHTLGLIVEDISNSFFALLAKVVEDEADKHGYKVMFCSTENNEEKAESLLNMLKNRQMDGFIITPTPGLAGEVEKLHAENRPVVLIDRYFPDLDISYVAIDNYRGSLEGVNFLIKQGYKNIAIITIESSQVQMEQRYNGYVDALKQNDIPFQANLVKKILFDLPHDLSVQEVMGFLRKEKAVDAVFCATNYLGIYALEAIRLLGKKIPADIGIISFDDNDLFRLGSPGISVIAQPIQQIGKHAVETIIEQLNTKTRKAKHQVLAPTLIVRESSINQD